MPGKWHTEIENLFPKEMQEVKFQDEVFFNSSLFPNRNLAAKSCPHR